MNVTINIDDETMKKLMDSGIELLDQDEIKEITTSAIKAYMLENKENIMEKAFFEKKERPYSINTYEPTKFLEKLVENLNYPDFQDMVDECAKYLKTEYKKIIEHMITTFMINGMTRSDDFRNALSNTLYEMRR